VSPEAARTSRDHQLLRSAQISCLIFGLGLIVWGLFPAVAHRLTSEEAPSLRLFLANAPTVVLGAAFVALFVWIGRRATWALWTAFGLALLLLANALLVALLAGPHTVPLFPVALSLCTATTTAFAIAHRRIARRTGQPADDRKVAADGG